MLINVNFNGSVNPNRLENKNLRKNLPFRTNSYPSDSVSFSGKDDNEDNKKSLYLKIAAGLAVVGAIIAGVALLKRGKTGKTEEVFQNSKHKTEQVVDDLKEDVNSGRKPNGTRNRRQTVESEQPERQNTNTSEQPERQNSSTSEQPERQNSSTSEQPGRQNTNTSKQPERQNSSTSEQPGRQNTNTSKQPERQNSSTSEQPEPQTPNATVSHKSQNRVESDPNPIDDLKIAREQIRFQQEIEIIKKTMLNDYGYADDEVAALFYNKLKNENFPGISFFDKATNEEFVNEVFDGAMENVSPLEKERLLTKLFELRVGRGRKTYVSKKDTMSALNEIKIKFQKLYQTKDVEFNGGMVERVSSEINRIFQETKDAKKLKEFLGSEADYELYQTLLEKSENYEDCIHKKTNPMYWLNLDSERSNSITFFVNTLPDIIKSEKNPIKQEDLWMKYLEVLKKDYNNKTTAKYFETLIEMTESLYKKTGSDSVAFKHKSEIDKRINGLINEFIFDRFQIPEIKSKEDAMDLAVRVIKTKSAWGTQPEDISLSEIANALIRMGKEKNNETYYQAALNIAKKYKDNDCHRALTERLLKDDSITPELRQQLINLTESNNANIEKITKEILTKFESRTYEEALEALKANPEIMEAARNLPKKYKIGELTEAQILEKLQQGDFFTIYRVVNDASEKTPRTSELWDDMIIYLGKIDKVVTDPEKLEKLKNVRALLLGNKIFELKNTNPDIADGYFEVLKIDLRDMLYGKGTGSSLAKDLSVNEELIYRVTKLMSEITIAFQPTTVVFGSLDKLLEREIYFRELGFAGPAYAKANNHELFSDKAFEELRLKRNELKTRLKIKTEDDFYQEYYEKYRQATGHSDLNRSSAIDILNKYLPEGNKLEQDADKDAIKQAYRELAIKYHPDKDTSDAGKAEKTEIFMEIGKAYEALTKKNK